MADGDTVKMKLTFWRDGKNPGDLIDVPADEVHRWTGFAVLAGESESGGDSTTPTDATTPEPKPSAQPADNAKVDEWRLYAVSLGMEQDKADGATKKDLQDFVAGTTAGAQA
ncbi:hypothetical protein ABZ341_18465 [Streptomyces sp. NPDC006173]|uniref:hypothetical protein n=1 Tax=Streptomyces sp. NPDC006173 TaxID=3155349 RepID=UPI0033FA2754